MQTVVGHRCEIWSLGVLHRPSGAILVTGAADELVRGYRLCTSTSTTTNTSNTTDADSDDSMRVIEFYGSVERQPGGNGSFDKCAGLSFNPAGSLLAAQSSGKIVEFFRVRSAAEAKKKCKRRTKRTEKKGDTASNTTSTNSSSEGEVFNSSMLVLSDELESLPSHTIRCAARVRSFAFDPSYTKHTSTTSSSGASSGSTGKGSSCKGLLSLVNNTLEVYVIPLTENSDEHDTTFNPNQSSVPSKLSVIDLHGHKSDVRAVSMSGDGSMVATCSNESIKVCVQCF